MSAHQTEEFLAAAVARGCRVLTRPGPNADADEARAYVQSAAAPVAVATPRKPAKRPELQAYGYTFRSKTELAYARVLQMRKVAGQILDWRYEPLTFHLVGGRYRPDFALSFHPEHYPGRSPEIHEVKPARAVQRITGRGRDSLRALKEAAHAHPEYVFYLARLEPEGWVITEVAPERECAGASPVEAVAALVLALRGKR